MRRSTILPRRRPPAATLLAAGAAFALVGLAAPEAPRAEVAALVSPGRAPFGTNVIPERIPLYDRATPVVGTAGPIDDDGVEEAKRVGFRSIIALQPASAAGLGEEELDVADYVDIRYVGLPVAGDVPAEEQVAEFARLLDDEDNLPALVHSADIDRVGAMWALYRAALGVPPEIAYLDGLTAGLDESADEVRARLGLAPAAAD